MNLEPRGFMLTLCILFVMFPVWQMFKYRQLGLDTITWRDVFWLLAYFIVGFTALSFIRDWVFGLS